MMARVPLLPSWLGYSQPYLLQFISYALCICTYTHMQLKHIYLEPILINFNIKLVRTMLIFKVWKPMRQKLSRSYHTLMHLILNMWLLCFSKCKIISVFKVYMQWWGHNYISPSPSMQMRRYLSRHLVHPLFVALTRFNLVYNFISLL